MERDPIKHLSAAALLDIINHGVEVHAVQGDAVLAAAGEWPVASITYKVADGKQFKSWAGCPVWFNTYDDLQNGFRAACADRLRQIAPGAASEVAALRLSHESAAAAIAACMAGGSAAVDALKLVLGDAVASAVSADIAKRAAAC